MVIIRSKPGPFEIMFCCAAFIGGVLILFSIGRTSAASVHLPAWTFVMLGLGMMVGSATTLVGVIRNKVWAILFESAGLILLSMLFLVYDAIIVTYNGLKLSVSLEFFLLFSAAASWRVVQIYRELKSARKDIFSAQEEKDLHEG